MSGSSDQNRGAMRLLKRRRGAQAQEGPQTLPGTVYREAGHRYLELFIRLGGLKPDHAVLEPGCGTGRMARPLTGYLSAGGSYSGFDVMPEAIETCVREIASDHPTFRFQHVDVHNGHYNPEGRLEPESFAFPYPDESSDFVFLTSVFTHMRPPEVRHYLDEIRRVLRPAGRSLMTFFLLNPDSTAAIEAGRTKRTFAYEGDGYRYDIEGRPEVAIAYREEDALSLIEAAGLALHPPVHHGLWSGHRSSPAGQDVVVVTRAG
jgi:SAM-dependent methyltransferase